MFNMPRDWNSIDDTVDIKIKHFGFIEPNIAYLDIIVSKQEIRNYVGSGIDGGGLPDPAEFGNSLNKIYNLKNCFVASNNGSRAELSYLLKFMKGKAVTGYYESIPGRNDVLTLALFTRS